MAEVARRHDVASSLIYKWRQQALSVNNGGPSFAPALVVMEEPARSGGKAASQTSVAISVELRGGTRVNIGATAPASLVTATLRALR